MLLKDADEDGKKGRRGEEERGRWERKGVCSCFALPLLFPMLPTIPPFLSN